MTLTHVSADTDPAEITKLIAAHGAVIVDDLLPLDVLDQFAEEIAPYIETNSFGSDDFSGRQTRRTGALIARSRAARQIAMNPTVLEAVGRVIHAQKYQLHLTQVISLWPGQGGQPMHRDQWAWDQFPFPPGKEVEVSAIWAMSEFTEENGATHVLPGSHLDSDHLKHKRRESVQAVMRRGSVILYTGSVYHAGGTNRSDAVRHALQFVYCAAWLRQEENQYLSTPPEIARELPDDLLKLMGYDLGSYSLGYVDDMRHPIDAVRGVGDRRGFGDDKLLPAARLR
jgi:ectoine hydroxylase-related dioxygenase (phytanoyl-CoA dioxygenase family)